MARTCVVTGSASGMGKATAGLLGAQGHAVLTVDLHGADVNADLSVPEGRQAAIAAVTGLSGGAIDAFIHCAGSAAYRPTTMALNFFGSVALLEGLRPLLARGADPRAVVVTSYAALMNPDPAMIEAALSGNEALALELGADRQLGNYTSSKAALAQWCRAAAVRPEWAGEGILLNTVAPGMVDTPMIAHRLATPASYEEFKRALPLPVDRPAQPIELARLFAFLASPENSFIVGQNIYADGGTEAVVRGPQHF